MKPPKYRIGDMVAVKADDPEKLLMSVIVGAELTNDTKWFYLTEGRNIYSKTENHGRYEEDIMELAPTEKLKDDAHE